MSGRIALSRVRDFNGMIKKEAIFVDDRHVGAVGYGQREIIEVEPGQHEVHVRMNRGRSPATQVSVSEGDTVELRCGVTGGFVGGLINTLLWRTQKMLFVERIGSEVAI